MNYNLKQLQLEAAKKFFEVSTEEEIPNGIKLLFGSMKLMEFEEGEDIVTFGAEPDDGMYMVIKGALTVLDSNDQIINYLGEGDVIGEVALLNDDIRRASVRASSNVLCLNLDKKTFDQAGREDKHVYGGLMNLIYRQSAKIIQEREKARATMEVAERIQQNMLRKDFSEFDKYPGIDVFASMNAAVSIGGDFYNVFPIDEYRICFLVADVSGKGIPAALFMALATTNIRNYGKLGMPVEELAYETNNRLCEGNEEELFATAFIVILDTREDELSFVNAGHCAPLISVGDDGFIYHKSKANFVLGMMEDMPYQVQKLPFPKGSTIFIYSDGVPEAKNEDGNMIGEEAIEVIFNENAPRWKAESSTAKTIVEDVFSAIEGYRKKADRYDDVTMLCLKRG